MRWSRTRSGWRRWKRWSRRSRISAPPGGSKAIPRFNNSEALLRELRSLLTGTGEYSLDFGDGTTQQGYIVLRPVSMTYRTGTYEQSRAIIDRLSASDNINRISDLSIRRDERSGGQGYQTMLTVTYFEVAP